MKNFQNYRRKNWTNYETQTRIIMMFFKQNQNVSFFDDDIDNIRVGWTLIQLRTPIGPTADSDADFKIRDLRFSRHLNRILTLANLGYGLG